MMTNGGIAMTQPPVATRVVRFEWPGLPDMSLTANGRRALGRYVAARVRQARADAILLYKAAGVDKVTIPKGARVSLHWTTVEHDYAGTDPDGLADVFKPMVDSLCKPRGVQRAQPGIGLLFNDSPKYVRTVSYTVEVDKDPRCPVEWQGRAPLTILEIEVLDA